MEHSTRLSLAGVYRPPLTALGAGLDRAVFHKVAEGTVRSFLVRVADVLGPPPEPAGTVQGTDRTGPLRAGQRPKCLARLPSGEWIRLVEIEHDVPDVPDRQVQLVNDIDIAGYLGPNRP